MLGAYIGDTGGGQVELEDAVLGHVLLGDVARTEEQLGGYRVH